MGFHLHGWTWANHACIATSHMLRESEPSFFLATETNRRKGTIQATIPWMTWQDSGPVRPGRSLSRFAVEILLPSLSPAPVQAYWLPVL